MTTLTPLSPEPPTPGSPPSEMSAPLSSLAVSVPSVALSPCGEEERPLLRQPHKASSRTEQKRNSSHYNHGHVVHSLPPSPLFTTEDVNFQVSHDTRASGTIFPALHGGLDNTNNNVSDCSTQRVADRVLHYMESSTDSLLNSEAEEPQGELTSFLTTESTAALLLRAMGSSRTNPASLNGDLKVESPYPTIKQNPVAV
ncbi:pro-neuregulin-1, membrane-bound isoform-like [Pholidichthys leucotaenia]